MSLPHAILGLLTYRPMTGYDLKQVFDSSINYFWTAHQSQIYRELSALEGKGYVDSRIELQEKRPDRKVYRITSEGEQELQHWLEQFPAVLTTPVREELLVRIFFASRLPLSELKFQLQRFLRERQSSLASHESIGDMIGAYAKLLDRPDEAFYWMLTLKRGIANLKAEIRWAEESIEEIEERERCLAEQESKAADQTGNATER